MLCHDRARESLLRTLGTYAASGTARPRLSAQASSARIVRSAWPDPLESSHTEREQCPLILEPPKLALDGTRALGVARPLSTGSIKRPRARFRAARSGGKWRSTNEDDELAFAERYR